MRHSHRWGGWNQWTQTCHQSRSRTCVDCGAYDTESRTQHDWHIGKDERGRTVKECRRCGTRA